MFDVVPFCLGAAQVQSCLADEEAARQFLASNWESYPPDNRRRCVDKNTDNFLSYAKLRDCLAK
jgi:hypothetical protein